MKFERFCRFPSGRTLSTFSSQHSNSTFVVFSVFSPSTEWRESVGCWKIHTQTSAARWESESNRKRAPSAVQFAHYRTCGIGTITLKTASCKFYSTENNPKSSADKVERWPWQCWHFDVCPIVRIFPFPWFFSFFLASLAFPALNGIWMWKPSPLHCVDIFRAACRLIICLSLRCRWGWALECVRDATKDFLFVCNFSLSFTSRSFYSIFCSSFRNAKRVGNFSWRFNHHYEERTRADITNEQNGKNECKTATALQMRCM